MGTPGFAAHSLRRLVEEGYNVVAVVTMPDKPAGRGLRVQESDVKRCAVEAGLPVLQPERLKDPAFVESFRALEADLGIVIAFRMLPEVIWSAPRLGTFNLHASLLPQYRGAAPINWAIINGETQTGVTTFMLNTEIDKGAILGSRTVPILPMDDAGTLHDKLMETGAGLVVETVDAIASGAVAPCEQPQGDVEFSPAPKIFREDCLIRWDRSPEEIYDFVRGLSPYPAAWAYLSENTQPYVVEAENAEGEILRGHTPPVVANPSVTQVKIYRVAPEPSDHSNRFGGIESDGKTYLKVACRGGWVRIEELQQAGKKRMSAAEFLRGCRDIRKFGF